MKTPAFKIADYFEMSAPQQKEIINQLENRKDLWGAIPFIINCLKKEGQSQVSPTDGGFHDLLGPGRFFLMMDESNKAEITVKNKTGVCPRLAAYGWLGHMKHFAGCGYGFFICNSQKICQNLKIQSHKAIIA